MPKTIHACRLSVLSLAIFSTFTAQADSLSAVETLEVRGQREAYRGDFDYLKSPEAIFEINSQLIDSTGAQGLTQVLDLSSSVTRQNSLGGLWDSFAIRGFFGDEDVPSGYLVNGFNAGRGFSGPRDVSGIERVEVLKGPKAALFGRGEPGGSINLITKKPSYESASELTLTLGSRQQRRVEGDVNGALSEQIAGRLVGFYQEEDSFRDTLEIEKHGVLAAFRYDHSDRSTWSYELEYAKQEIPFDRGIIALQGNFDFMPIERFLGEPGDGPTTTEVHGHQIQWQYAFNDNWRLSSGLAFRQTELDSLSSDADVSPSRQKLYYDGKTLTRQHRQRAYDTDQYVGRVELSGELSTGSVVHNIMLGIDYDRFEFDRDYRVARAPSLSTMPSDEQLYALNIHNPVYGQFTPPTPSPVTVRQQNQWATGIYLQDQITLTGKLQLRVGGRFDWLRQTTDDRLSQQSAKQSEQHFSPQLGLVYMVSDNWSVYSTYGEGYRLNFGTDHQGQGFEPNQSESSEIGSKWSLFDNDLEVTLAYFDSEQTNIIVADIEHPGFDSAIGKASSKGVELDIAGQLPADINVWFSYTYLDAQVEKDSIDTGLYVGIKAGDDLLNIPDHAASLQLSQYYRVSGRPLTVGTGLQYVDERLGQRGSDFYLPSYVIANLFAEYDITDRWQVKAQIHNLFDRKHFTNSYTQMWVQPGEPRRIQVSVSYYL